MTKTKRNCDAATAELKKLLDKRDAFRSQELMKAVAESPLSYEDIIALIRAGGQSPREDE